MPPDRLQALIAELAGSGQGFVIAGVRESGWDGVTQDVSHALMVDDEMSSRQGEGGRGAGGGRYISG